MTAPPNGFDDCAALDVRLTNLRVGPGYQLGAETDDGLLNVTATAAARGLPAPRDVDELLHRGLGAQVAAVLTAVTGDSAGAVYADPAQLDFGPVVTRPEKILCVGFNYRRHAEETHTDVGDVPDLFGRFGNSLMHHGGVVHLPTDTARYFDYETELVIVIGRRCRDVSRDDALDHVAGYTVGNDVSCRDLQLAQVQLTAGKISDETAPVGPWLTPASRIPDPNALAIRTRVNGEVRQDWTTSDMIFDCRFLVSYLSSILTLKPGDIIFTGTPQGVILGQTAPLAERRWLRPGDEVSSEIERLGTLGFALAATSATDDGRGGARD